VDDLFPPCFESFADAIRGLPHLDRLQKADLLVEQFRVFKDERIEICYAPFDFVNIRAKVAIVGITPGWTQMEIAFRQASAVLHKGGTATEASQRAKEEASFAGAMRNNLVKMLDEIGLQDVIGIESCHELFGTSRHLVHTTSAVRHPVFIHGQNYAGHSPDLLSHPVLRRYVEEVLASELTATLNSLVVPLGRCVDNVLQHLIQIGALSERRCLLGFPHPSGLNGHRRVQFELGREEFVRVAKDWATST